MGVGSVSAKPLTDAVQLELARLDANREAAFARLAYLNAQGITGAGVREVWAAFDRVEAGCGKLHAAHWPRHNGELFVSGGAAYLRSATGRSVRQVWQRPIG
jgi:hypothetical protein